jgi:hypothetical protein
MDSRITTRRFSIAPGVKEGALHGAAQLIIVYIENLKIFGIWD